MRLAALMRMADFAHSDGDILVLARHIVDGKFDHDRGLMDAATAAAARHDVKVLDVLTKHKFVRPPSLPTITIASRLAEHHSRGGPGDSMSGMMSALALADPRVSQAIIAGFARGWPKTRRQSSTLSWIRSIAALLPRLSTDARAQMLGLASRWGVKGLDGFIAQLASDFLATAADEKATDLARVDAARASDRSPQE